MGTKPDDGRYATAAPARAQATMARADGDPGDHEGERDSVRATPWQALANAFSEQPVFLRPPWWIDRTTDGGAAHCRTNGRHASPLLTSS